MQVGILRNIYMKTTNIRRTLPHLHIRYEPADSKGRLSSENFHSSSEKLFGKQASQLPNRYEANHTTSTYIGLQSIGKVSLSASEVLSIKTTVYPSPMRLFRVISYYNPLR